MPEFGSSSKRILKDAHPILIRLMEYAIAKATPELDFSVICSYRGYQEQMDAYNSGRSKAKWLQSPHNFKPSLAVDCTPFPLNWKDIGSFDRLAAHIKKCADDLDIAIRWGGDFKGFYDGPHFELANWKDMRG